MAATIAAQTSHGMSFRTSIFLPNAKRADFKGAVPIETH
jgi:hypothetical protein